MNSPRRTILAVSLGLLAAGQAAAHEVLERRIWRDLSVVLAPDADPEAKRAAEIMKTEGWTR